MQTKEQVIEKLINELDEIKTKIFKLETFMSSKDFMKITMVQKQLLEEQHTAMTHYKTVLLKRIYNLRFESAQEVKITVTGEDKRSLEE